MMEIQSGSDGEEFSLQRNEIVESQEIVARFEVDIARSVNSKVVRNGAIADLIDGNREVEMKYDGAVVLLRNVTK